MAKVIWWLAIIIVALVNRVLPYHMEEIPFVEGKYYGQDLVGIEDPAALYNSFFAPQSEFYTPCIPQNMPFSDSYGKMWSMSVPPQATYFLPASEKTRGEPGLLTYSISGETIMPILAPLNCTIETELNNSANSTYMKVNIPATGHTIYFKNMDHWYCCHGHKRMSASGFKHYGVTDADYSDRVIKQGEILGFANENTIVSIIDKDGNEVSFDKFFLGDDTTTFTTTLSEMNRVTTDS